MIQHLHVAKKNKNDEYYTLYRDIQKEMQYYVPYFKDKIIYCNCDDGNVSNFFKYFVLNFEKLQLKKVICTGLTVSAKMPGVFSYDGGKYIYCKKNDGYFENNIELLQMADIIVTNPPFSMFRDYFDMLIRYNKKFIILMHQNAIGYKNIFPLLRDKEIYIGNNYTNNFLQSDGSIKKIGDVLWFTNLCIDKQKHVVFSESYSAEKYKKYDNYDAINVDRLKDIPYDYNGVMGVPLTYLKIHDDRLYDIVGFRKGVDGKDLRYIADGKVVQPFTRILIKKKIV